MSDNSAIEWCDATWNPILGCSYVSEGCKNCYAVRTANRVAGNPSVNKDGILDGLVAKDSAGRIHWTGKVALLPDRLTLPLRWKQPKPDKRPCRTCGHVGWAHRGLKFECIGAVGQTCDCPDYEYEPFKIFVASQSDPFHEDVPDDFIYAMLTVAAHTPWFIHQWLTKRPERMAQWFDEHRHIACDDHLHELPLGNVWLGVSVENQFWADERIPLLLNTPAAVRFISAEPLLGPVDIAKWLRPHECICDEPEGLHTIDCSEDGLQWVIAGGESGPKARPMHPDWPRNLRDQCQAAGVPYFFKQWGEHIGVDVIERFDPHLPDGREGKVWKASSGRQIDTANAPIWFDDDHGSVKIGKKAAGAVLDGREWREFPA